MKKHISRILAISSATILGLCSVVSYADTIYEGMTTIEDYAKTTTFDKYLVMREETQIPEMQFEFIIEPGEAVDSIKAGVGSPTISFEEDDITGSVIFGPDDETISYKDIENTDNISFLREGDKYSKKTATIDFSSVIFPEPGIYRYVITETNGEQLGVTYDANSTRTLDVYVEDASTADEKLLKIAGYVLHTDDIDSENYKSHGFTNKYGSYDLTFSKTVDGNQASYNKYFAFTVNIEGAMPEFTYSVDISNADAETPINSVTIEGNSEQPNVTSITTDENGNASAMFYLKHNQSITIANLNPGTKWNITENEEDYKPSVIVTEENGDAIGEYNSASDSVSGIMGTTTVEFTNTRNGIIPTGVILTIAPFVGITAIGAIGAVFIVVKKKSKKD